MKKVEEYILKMENEFDSFQKEMYENKPILSFKWLWEHNEPLKKYVADLSIGAGFTSLEENKQAYESTFKKYVETMNVFYKLTSGTEFFKIN